MPSCPANAGGSTERQKCPTTASGLRSVIRTLTKDANYADIPSSPPIFHSSVHLTVPVRVKKTCDGENAANPFLPTEPRVYRLFSLEAA